MVIVSIGWVFSEPSSAGMLSRLDVSSYHMVLDLQGQYPGLLTWQPGSKNECSRE